MATFLVPIERVKRNTYIDGNVDDKTIKLALTNAQEQLLEPVIGSALYEKLTGGIAEGNLELDYQNLIINYIWKILYHGTTFMVARNLLFRYTNSSIVKDSNQNSTAIDAVDLNTLRDEEFNSYQFQVDKLMRFLKANASQFPEYYEVDDDGLAAEEQQNSLGFYYDGPEID